MYKQRYIYYLLGLLFLFAGTSAFGAPAKNEVKGQGQLEGFKCQFKTVYSLQHGFNFAILSGCYTIEPFISYDTPTAGTNEKLVVLDIAIKNAKPEDNWFPTDDLFTLVDDKGQLYPYKSFALVSKGYDAPDLNLRPGQGLGQPEQKDPLRFAFVVPAKARIVKIMVNHGRVGKQNEKALRYYVAGATKAEAGEDGDPMNVIASLPEVVKDPSDHSGAVALDEGKGAPGVYLPSGCFYLRLDGFAYSTEPLLDGNPPEEGKRFAVATVTVKNIANKPVSMFEALGGDAPLYEISDSDGETEKPTAFRKATRDESPECEFKQGSEYKFRILFTLPKEAVAKKLVLGTIDARKWVFDVSTVK
jgi:hypothetical protein